MLPLLRCFFAHLLILQYPDHHQNLISSYLYYSGPVHKISSQSVHNFLSNVVHRQTNRQTNQRYQKHSLLCQGGNDLWKLIRMTNGCFKWQKINFDCDVKLPAPRVEHSSWEYEECLWIFGGITCNPVGYLSDYPGGFTNQLLCYVASTNKWTNPKCFGIVPDPRVGHNTAIINNKVWLYGGLTISLQVSEDIFGLDIYELDMLSHTWTHIHTGPTKPPGRFLSSLTKLSENQLILHGGDNLKGELFSGTWVMDLSSYTWRRLSSSIDHFRAAHKGCFSMNRNVVIFGGYMEPGSQEMHKKSYKATFHIMLELKSLQQLAMKTIYLQRDELPWMDLPPRLITQLGLSVN